MKSMFAFWVCVLMVLGLFASCEIEGDTEYMVSNDTGFELILHEYNGNGVEVKTREVIWDETFKAVSAARKVLVSHSDAYGNERWIDQIYQLRRGERIIIRVTGKGWSTDKPKIK